MPTLRLHSGRDYSVRRGHPWIFSGAIAKIEGEVEDGDVVRVVSSDGEFLALGHFGTGSIAVKVFSRGRERDAEESLSERIQEAVATRRVLGLLENPEISAFRLINGEGDGLPGLIVDCYRDCAVFQFHSVGMWKSRETLVSSLLGALPDRFVGIYHKSETTLRPLQVQNSFLFGAHSGKAQIQEWGAHYEVDIFEGQKTGFYLDQRENRRAVRECATGKAVLNCFSYTGGFSIAALLGGARKAVSVDASRGAIDMACRHAEMNSVSERHEGIVADCLEYMNEIRDTFDLIILDPPAFVKHKKALEGALRGYETINSLALSKVSPGGLVFTFSCSQLVGADLFREVVQKAALRAERNVQILREMGPSLCHPANLFHPEGRYLKGFILRVDR
ncbi:MAG: class I SAM-dependent rRNA methyltransferase [Bdellovibrionales bacterium]|nr:class I SAM-dependent rRNA methyltransferase [Bdellovibrionales bacterium]